MQGGAGLGGPKLWCSFFPYSKNTKFDVTRCGFGAPKCSKIRFRGLRVRERKVRIKQKRQKERRKGGQTMKGRRGENVKRGEKRGGVMIFLQGLRNLKLRHCL